MQSSSFADREMTHSFLNGRLRIYLKEQSNLDVGWKIFVAPFSRDLWLLFLCLVFATSAIFSILMVVVQKFMDIESYVGLFNLLIIFCNQGAAIPTIDNFQRIVHFFLNILSVILWTAYSAVLFSYFAVQTFGPPFENVQKLMEDGSYRLSAITPYKVSLLYKYLERIERMLFYSHAVNVEADLFNTCKKQKLGMLLSFSLQPYMELANRLHCKLGVINLGSVEHYGFSVAIKSPYKDRLNQLLIHRQEVGIDNQIYQEHSHDDVIPFTGVSIAFVTPILVVLLAGIIMAISLLLFEKFVWKVAERIAKVVSEQGVEDGHLSVDSRLSLDYSASTSFSNRSRTPSLEYIHADIHQST